jgi:hypothetical protein
MHPPTRVTIYPSVPFHMIPVPEPYQSMLPIYHSNPFKMYPTIPFYKVPIEHTFQ